MWRCWRSPGSCWPAHHSSQHPGHLDGRGRGAGAQRRPWGLPLPRAPGVPRRRVPDPGRRTVSIYRLLERLAPAGLAVFSSGDLLIRLISDVDATQDLFIRGIAPPLAAALAGAWSVIACLVILTPAGALLAAPAGRRDRHPGARRRDGTGRRQAPGAGPRAAGRDVHRPSRGRRRVARLWRQDTALTPVTAADRDLTRQADRNAAVAGLSAGLSSAIAGLTVWGVLLLGVAATGDGALARVPLAVLTLTALASFEVVIALPAAAVQLGQARVSGRRIAAVLDAPDPVREPPAPRPLPDGPVRVRLHGAQVRYEPGGRAALDGIDLDLPPGRRVALIGPNGAGKSTVASVLLRFVELTAGTATLNGHDLASYSRTISGPGSAAARRIRTSSTRPCETTSAWPSRRPPMSSSPTRPPGPGCWTGSGRCRSAGIRAGARGAALSGTAPAAGSGRALLAISRC